MALVGEALGRLVQRVAAELVLGRERRARRAASPSATPASTTRSVRRSWRQSASWAAWVRSIADSTTSRRRLERAGRAPPPAARPAGSRAASPAAGARPRRRRARRAPPPGPGPPPRSAGRARRGPPRAAAARARADPPGRTAGARAGRRARASSRAPSRRRRTRAASPWYWIRERTSPSRSARAVSRSWNSSRTTSVETPSRVVQRLREVEQPVEQRLGRLGVRRRRARADRHARPRGADAQPEPGEQAAEVRARPVHVERARRPRRSCRATSVRSLTRPRSTCAVRQPVSRSCAAWATSRLVFP